MKKIYTFLMALSFCGLGFGQGATVEPPVTQGAITTISSTVDTEVERSIIFRFTLKDLGGDGLDTKVTNIKFTPSATNTASWASSIAGVHLSQINTTIPISTTISDTAIELAINSGDLVIAEGDDDLMVVRIWLKNDGGLVDNSIISFFISDINDGFTADPIDSSAFNSTFPLGAVQGNDITIQVFTTGLTILQQPLDVEEGALFANPVQVAFTDENGNLDVDASGAGYEVELFATAPIFVGSNTFVEAINGIVTFDDLIFTEQTLGVELEFLDYFDFSQAFSDLFDVTPLPLGSVDYTYTGTWSPSDPNGSATSVDRIFVNSGDASITQTMLVFSVNVQPGASLTVAPSTTLGVVNSLTLESQSDSYSSFIFNGTKFANGTAVGGPIRYNRFVNANSGATGNDLISPPLTGQGWLNFLNFGDNKNRMLNNGGTTPGRRYSFGPFNKSTGAYLSWADNTSATLISGTGYRAATSAGTTLTFSGDVRTNAVPVTLTFGGSAFQDWNLVGNPYPSYVSIADFLGFILDTGDLPGPEDDVLNISLFSDGSGMYGYDGDASDGWDVITLANAGSRLLAPGQGFLVPADPDGATGGGGTVLSGIRFDPSMRTTGSSDDFISGRSADTDAPSFFKLKAFTSAKSYMTQFYFNNTSSLGLDHGYDGKILGTAPNFALYSELVEDNTGLKMALQSLNLSDLSSTTVIPLGVNANAGEQLTFSIIENSLPSDVEIYLEDTETNTFTLLNSSDYILTPSLNLSGTGRFYLRFETTALSVTETTLADLSIYANPSNKTIIIDGVIGKSTMAQIYDIQGRLVQKQQLSSATRTQSIDASNLSAGVYVVQIANGTQNKTQKVVIN